MAARARRGEGSGRRVGPSDGPPGLSLPSLVPHPAPPAVEQPHLSRPPQPGPRRRVSPFAALAALALAAGGAGLLSVHQAPFTLPPAAFAVAGGRTLVTPAVAASAASTVWSLQHAAMAHGDFAVIADTTAPGPLLEAQRFTYGNPHCPCPNPHIAMTYQSLSVVAPSERAYPLSFLAEFSQTVPASVDDSHTPAARWVELDVFVKRDAESPWQIALSTGLRPPAEFGAPVTLAPGEAPYDPASPVYPNDIFGTLANNWQSFPVIPVSSRGASLPSASAVYGQFLSARRSDQRVDGYDVSYRYFTEPSDGAFTFGTRHPKVSVSCSTVRAVVTLTPTKPGGVFTQDVGRATWGTWVAPGRYGAIVDASVYQSCVLTQPSIAERIVFGVSDAIVSRRAERAG